MAQEGWGPFEGPDVVDKDSIKTTLSKVSAGSSRRGGQELDYEEEDEAILTLTSDQIIDAFTGKDNDDQSVKVFVRSYNISAIKVERRALLQEMLSKINRKENSQVDAKVLFNDTLVSCFGSTDMPSEVPPLPNCIDRTHTNAYYLTQYGKISVARILCCFAYNHPDVQYCPMIYPITAILRHYLSEADTYNFVSNMASSRNQKYISQTRMQHEVSWRTAFCLCTKISEKHMRFLEAESSFEELEGLFQQWVWWIFDWLPFPHVVRIIDPYLLEGEKILYRICFAIISIFVRHIKTKGSSWNGSIKQRGLQGAFIHFCKEIPVNPNNLLNKCFRYRNFSRSNIQKANNLMEMELKVKLDGEIYLADISSVTSDNKNRTVVSDVRGDIPDASALQALSSILTYKQLMTIWRWIPDRIIMAGTPSLAYSSDNDGFSLKTFYNKSEMYEPTVLVIKTTKGDVFGAYCSTSWRERNTKDEKGARQAYFGTGESFLFSFSLSGAQNNTSSTQANGKCDNDSEHAKKFSWIFTSESNPKETGNLTKVERHARELFMCGQHDMLTIGGGGGNGIYIESTLSHGKTETCQTFDNAPLCKDGDFEIAAIEVYGLLKLDY